MKQTVTKTVTQTQTLCDHCGKEVLYSSQFCVVCGKFACDDCFYVRLVVLELEKFPQFWPPGASLPTFHAYACKTCSNKITRRFEAIKSRTEKRNSQCKAWHKRYLEQLQILGDWKIEAEKKYGND